MDFLKCMSNFPWNRFATVYETNSIGLKGIFIKMFNNTAEMSDYQYVIDRLECQDTLYRITPWDLNSISVYLWKTNRIKTYCYRT